jgi:hypothetical protein
MEEFFKTYPAVSWLIVMVMGGITVGLVKREFNRFDDTLKKMCTDLDTKATHDDIKDLEDQNEEAHRIIWGDLKHHGHKIECDTAVCKPYTSGVLTPEKS